jgi:chemotaxis protein methyltransferase CheR
MLDRGKLGIFAEEQLRDVPPTLRDRYFRLSQGGMAIDEDLRDMVHFRRLNLSRLPFPMTGPLQAIFCHEGLVPLVAGTRLRLAESIKELLAEDGLLCTGFSDEALAASDSDPLASEGGGPVSLRHGHC